MFRVTVEEVFPTSDLEVERKLPIERYAQTVDQIDLKRVMDAVNSKPRKSRAKPVGGAA